MVNTNVIELIGNEIRKMNDTPLKDIKTLGELIKLLKTHKNISDEYVVIQKEFYGCLFK